MATATKADGDGASARARKGAATRKRNAAGKTARQTRTSARATATTAKHGAQATRTSARRTATEAEQAAEATVAATEAEAKLRVNQVQQLAERLMLVQVGAGLTVRDNVVSTVKGIRDTALNPTARQRRLNRYEQRGTKARNRFERQVRSTRRRFERELRTAREDLGQQSSVLGSRAQKLVSDAQHRIGGGSTP